MTTQNQTQATKVEKDLTNLSSLAVYQKLVANPNIDKTKLVQVANLGATMDALKAAGIDLNTMMKIVANNAIIIDEFIKVVKGDTEAERELMEVSTMLNAMIASAPAIAQAVGVEAKASEATPTPAPAQTPAKAQEVTAKEAVTSIRAKRMEATKAAIEKEAESQTSKYVKAAVIGVIGTAAIAAGVYYGVKYFMGNGEVTE